MIPVCEPVLFGKVLQNVSDCIETGWISSKGKYIDQFESRWAEYCGRKYGIAVSNGTAALDTAVRCLNIGKGDEVIMPAFTIISCAAAIINAGATPVLTDINSRTWTMDINDVQEKITPKTKAIMPVHIYGHPVDMDPILDLVEDHNLIIIEDAAEAHGAEYRSRKCGSFGNASCFSFYANKIITTGEGGMVVTDDERLAEKCRKYRDLCFGSKRFVHDHLGNNYRMTNIQAAIGLSQIDYINQIIERKREIAAMYTRHLSGVSIEVPVEKPWAKSVYWMYAVALPFYLENADVINTLKLKGIEARPFFVGMHEQPVFKDRGLFKDESYPISEWYSRHGLYLPSGLGLTEEQIKTVSDAVAEVVS